MNARAPERLSDSDPDVLVVAVTYNSAAVVEQFLHSLHEALEGAPTAKIIIVDNDSSDGTQELVRTVAPWADLIDAGGNIGYAAGINVALRSVTPRLGAYILNPDTVPAAGSVRLLLQPALAQPGVGITVPCMRTAEGELFYSLRREPTILRALGEAVLGGSRAGRHAALGEVVSDAASYAEPRNAAWATGAAMFIHRRTLDAVGLWDEQFFLYSEETDYALRAHDAGLVLRYVPEAEVRHLGGDLGTSDILWSLMTHNRVRLYRKRHGPVASAGFWLAVTLGELLRAAAGKRRSRAALRALLSRRAHGVPGSGSAGP